ncbi:MAG: hypothetical protein HC936_09190 [Leptolyngbyaceae cyanobacterium SU_3_3]|nr:hypothetical protein [Leptolyngbyaceae cyanobacterium SU_3_3]
MIFSRISADSICGEDSDKASGFTVAELGNDCVDETVESEVENSVVGVKNSMLGVVSIGAEEISTASSLADSTDVENSLVGVVSMVAEFAVTLTGSEFDVLGEATIVGSVAGRFLASSA